MDLGPSLAAPSRERHGTGPTPGPPAADLLELVAVVGLAHLDVDHPSATVAHRDRATVGVHDPTVDDPVALLEIGVRLHVAEVDVAIGCHEGRRIGLLSGE